MFRIGPFCSLLLVAATLISHPGFSQEKTNTAALHKLEQKLVGSEIKLQKERIQIAALKGWPLAFSNKSGRNVILTGIDNFGFPLYTAADNEPAQTIGTNQLWAGGSTGLNLSGNSSRLNGKLGLWDEGRVRNSHVEIAQRALHRDNPQEESNHATHVAGTLIGKGVNANAKGMAFGAEELITYDFGNHLSEMTQEAGNLLLSNHSYGIIAGWNWNEDEDRWEFWGLPDSKEDYKFGHYNNETKTIDDIAFNAPYYLIVKSAGNNRIENGPDVGENYWGYNNANNLVNKGARPADMSDNGSYDCISTYGVAKNILTVGAIQKIVNGYINPGSAQMSSFSSWGPTDDGRIKPDIVADGVGVLSAIKNTDNSYGYMNGTSMAAPSITGSLLLLQEHYSALNEGNFMRAATLKGLVIHTADEAGEAPGPDYKFGWGVANMVTAAAVISAKNTDKLIQEHTLANAGTYTLQVYASGNEPLAATICWTDPSGNVVTSNLLNNRSPMLRNDLDLRIVHEDDQFLPWVLDVHNPTLAATTGDNSLDNVEKVVIAAPKKGTLYTIRVTNKGSLLNGVQAFSLIVTGTSGCEAGSVTAPEIIQHKNRLVSDNAAVQWWLDDVLLNNGATSKELVMLRPGNYYASLSYNNCQINSNTILAEAAAIIPELETLESPALVFPNPSKGNIRLAFYTATTGNLQVALYNGFGHAVFQELTPNFTGEYIKELQLKVQRGVYWLKIQHGNTKKQQKIVIY